MDKDSDVDFQKFILHFQPNQNLTDKQGRTILHKVASKGDLPSCRLLLQLASIDLAIEDNYGFNAYGLAMREE